MTAASLDGLGFGARCTLRPVSVCTLLCALLCFVFSVGDRTQGLTRGRQALRTEPHSSPFVVLSDVLVCVSPEAAARGNFHISQLSRSHWLLRSLSLSNH
jgi:hypothetical protein